MSRNYENSRLYSHGRLRSVLVALGAICAFFVLLTPPAFGQGAAGSVLGVVRDPSGGVVAGASVTITNTATGVTTTTKTNNEGLYVFPYVQPGVYDLTASASGFQTVKKPGVTVNVTERVQISFDLKVGNVKQTIEVTGAAPLLNTVSDAGGQIISRRVVNDLPLVNRSVLDLAFLAPGVLQPAGSTYGNIAVDMPYLQSNNFVSNGSRNATSDVLIDGITAGGVDFGGLTSRVAYTPSVDAVEEFKVQQTNFSAEYGNSGSTITNLITRSGTNQLHGSAYDFLRNNKLDSADYFENQFPAPLNVLPHLERNVYGGTVGGPVYIPHLYNGKNRTFFFFDYEGTRQKELASSNAGVPSTAEKTGDFTEFCNAVSELDGKGPGTYTGTYTDPVTGTQYSNVCTDPNGQLWDPYTAVYDPTHGYSGESRAPIPNNNIAAYQSPGTNLAPGVTLPAKPGNMLDPSMLKMFQFYPAPNFNQGAPGGGYSPYLNWVTSGATALNNYQWDLKIDQHFGDRNTLSAKYARRVTHSLALDCFNNIADPCSGGVGPQAAHLVAADFVRTFSPTTVLNFSYGFTRITRHLVPGAADPVTTLGMPSYIDTSGFKTLPTVIDYGREADANVGNNNQSIGGAPWATLIDNSETHDLLLSLTHVRGHHELKFGVEFRLNRYDFSQPGTPNGLFSYNGNALAQNTGIGGTGGDALAGMLTGAGGNWGQYEIPAWLFTQNHAWAGYAQDAFHASKKLTVNVGLRYDLSLPETERHNELSWLDPNVAYPSTVPGYPILHGGLMFAKPGERSSLNTDFRDIQPRLGLAYSLNDKTVIRTGYGIYYGMSRASANANAITPNDPGFDGTTTWQSAYYNSVGPTPWGFLSNPFPNGIVPVTGSSLGVATQIGTNASAPNGFDRSMNQTPYMQSWNFGIQRQLPANMLLDVEYIGQEGTHLFFGIGGNYNLSHLGKQEEQMTPAQLQALAAQVPNPFHGIIPNSNATTSQYQLDLPYPQFAAFDIASPPWANSSYQALQLRLEKRFSNGLQLLASYVWSKSLDDDSNPGNAGGTGLGFAPVPLDPNNLKLARSVSQYNIPQVFQFSYVYHLPFGRGERFGAKMNPVLNAIIGGWQTNGIWRFDDGQPMMVQLSSGNNALPGYGQAPELVGTPKANPKSKWFLPYSQGGGYFANPQVFQEPAEYTIGNTPRTLPWLRYPGTANTDLSLFKEFSLSRLREGMHLELRTEWFNAFNHPQFGNINTGVAWTGYNTTTGQGGTWNNPTFGQITGSDANSPRVIQMALKLYF
jgi:hypothetical protein